MKKHVFVIALVVFFLAIISLLGRTDHFGNHPAKPAATSKPPQRGATKRFDTHQYSTTDPASIWVVVNKQHPLSPKDFAPGDLTLPKVPLRAPGDESMQLRTVTATAVEALFAAAQADGLHLMLTSGYRSYAYQTSVYNGYVSSMGQARADTLSARPGHSEHQTGLALDIEPVTKTCELEQCFADTPEGAWLLENSYKYGFILRYMAASQAVTGYQGEPWHYRYVGIGLATEMHRAHVATLEQFFAISGGPDYSD